MNYLDMEKQYGWFKSLCIIAMCFTELSGSVNSLCLNLFVGLTSISKFFLQDSVPAILVDHSLKKPTDV